MPIFFQNLQLQKNEATTSKVDEKLLVRPDSNIKRSPNEKAVLVEFGDFQCPACGSYYPIVKQVVDSHSDDLTFVFRNFPLSQHKNALPSAYAVEAAGKQGKYWEMFDKIYSSQNDWEGLSNPKKTFETYAEGLGLDINKFKDDVDSKEIKDKVQADYQDGISLQVNATPTFFLNAQKLESPRSLDEFNSLVEAAIKNDPVQTSDNSSESQAYHAHFGLKVYLNGKAVDFSQKKYQSEEGNELNEWIHMHDGNGDIVHVHKEGTKLSDFFNSLKISFNNECVTMDTGEKYCTGNGKELKMYVNGKQNTEFENYAPQDLDRLLITYGSETGDALQKQIDSVSDEACIYSETCPERGTPPTENCVGGLGTGCEAEKSN